MTVLKSVHTIPDSLLSLHLGAPQPRWGALQHRHFSILVGPPWPGLAPLNFILHSSIASGTPLAHFAQDIRNSCFPGGAPLFALNSSSPVSNSVCIHCMLTSIRILLDITNRSKSNWTLKSPSRQAPIISKYQECLQLLCTIHELCVPAFLGPNVMGDSVDGIETMFD